MCSSIRINNLFGRNMDLDYSFNERIIITPSEFNLVFKKIDNINNHYSILGIGTIVNNYPLYADAINEHGLGFSALNFPNNAKYYEFDDNKINLAPYELCLYLLGKYKSTKEVIEALSNINIVDLDFSNNIKNTTLHFMISDKYESIIIETLNDGMKVISNSFDILTNSPPFTYHQENILNFIQLNNLDSMNNLNPKLNLKPYSHGLGAYGLPGDYSSSSRFIKGFFVKSFIDLSSDNITQFFKCLDSISIPKGCIKTNLGYQYTRYTSCYDLDNKILYFKTYESFNIKSIKLNEYNLNINKLYTFEI